MANENNRVAELEDQAGQVSQLPPALMQQFADMAMLLPETESDGGASIIEAILNTRDVSQLDSPWQTKDPEHLCGEWLVIESATRSLSDFTEGLGVFLVVQAYNENRKEKVTFTTGSMAVVAQVVAAYAQGALPLRAKMMMSEKPTKKGYRPMHLKIHAQQPGK